MTASPQSNPLVRRLISAAAGTGLAVFLGVGFTLIGGGSSSAESNPELGLLNVDELQEALVEAEAEYDYLPKPGAQQSRGRSAQMAEPVLDDEALYESGIEEMMVLSDWVCSWEREALDASAVGDTGRLNQAMFQLYSSLEIPKYVEYRIGQAEWAKAVLDPVATGDLAHLQSDYEFSCRN